MLTPGRFRLGYVSFSRPLPFLHFFSPALLASHNHRLLSAPPPSRRLCLTWACRGQPGEGGGRGAAARGRGRQSYIIGSWPAGGTPDYPGPYINVRHGTCTTPRLPGLGQPCPALPCCSTHVPCPPCRNPTHLICCTLPLPLAPSAAGTLLPGARNIHYSKQLFSRLVPGVVILGLRGKGAAAILTQRGKG